MIRNSPEGASQSENIFKKYMETQKSKGGLVSAVEAAPENTTENDAKAQTMVEKLFDRADQIPASEYQKILTLADLKEVVDVLVPENLTPIFKKGVDKDPVELLRQLKSMVSGLDYTTGLSNKFALNDSLRHTIIEIINTKDNAARIEKMRHSGLVYFDVRGLKMVNDARNNHSDGDAYIARVASETKVVAEQIFTQILGPQAMAGIFRDGGDEFAVTFHNSQHDLEATVTDENIAEIFPETITVRRPGSTTSETVPVRTMAAEIAGLSNTEETKEVKLITVLSAILEKKLFDQKFVSESFPREVIEAHLKKGQPGYKNEALAEFELPIVTAQGAETYFEVFKQTKNSYHKKIPSDAEITNLGAAQVVNMLMSATRLAADQKSYEAKNQQNRMWMESSDPFQQLLIDLVSRNEITLAYAESLRMAKEIILEIHEKLMTANTKLDAIKQAKERDLNREFIDGDGI